MLGRMCPLPKLLPLSAPLLSGKSQTMTRPTNKEPAPHA
jgi:hypothetical protein